VLTTVVGCAYNVDMTTSRTEVINELHTHLTKVRAELNEANIDPRNLGRIEQWLIKNGYKKFGEETKPQVWVQPWPAKGLLTVWTYYPADTAEVIEVNEQATT